jgi:hypothetical protein
MILLNKGGAAGQEQALLKAMKTVMFFIGGI